MYDVNKSFPERHGPLYVERFVDEQVGNNLVTGYTIMYNLGGDPLFSDACDAELLPNGGKQILVKIPSVPIGAMVDKPTKFVEDWNKSLDDPSSSKKATDNFRATANAVDKVDGREMKSVLLIFDKPLGIKCDSQISIGGIIESDQFFLEYIRKYKGHKFPVLSIMITWKVYELGSARPLRGEEKKLSRGDLLTRQLKSRSKKYAAYTTGST